MSDSFSEKQISGNLNEKTLKQNNNLPPKESAQPSLRKSLQNLPKNPRITNSKSTFLRTKLTKPNTPEFKINLGTPQASSSFEKNASAQIKNETKQASDKPKFSKESSNLKKTNTNQVLKAKAPLVKSNASSQFSTRSSTPNNVRQPNLVEQRMINAFKKTIKQNTEKSIKQDILSKIEPKADPNNEFLIRKPPINQNKLNKSNEMLEDNRVKSQNSDLNNNERDSFKNISDQLQKNFDDVKEQIKALQIQQAILFQKVSEISDKIDEHFNSARKN